MAEFLMQVADLSPRVSRYPCHYCALKDDFAGSLELVMSSRCESYLLFEPDMESEDAHVMSSQPRAVVDLRDVVEAGVVAAPVTSTDSDDEVVVFFLQLELLSCCGNVSPSSAHTHDPVELHGRMHSHVTFRFNNKRTASELAHMILEGMEALRLKGACEKKGATLTFVPYPSPQVLFGSSTKGKSPVRGSSPTRGMASEKVLSSRARFLLAEDDVAAQGWFTENPETSWLAVKVANSLADHLPLMVRLSDWTLLYSPGIHGTSLSNYYRRADEKPGPVVCILSTDSNEIVGLYASNTLSKSSSFGGGRGSHQACGKYFGGGQTFVFSVDVENRMSIYKWHGQNDMFLFCDENSIVVGGNTSLSEGNGPAIVISSDWLHGTTSSCATFGSPPLVSNVGSSGRSDQSNGGSVDFLITRAEIWSLNSS